MDLCSDIKICKGVVHVEGALKVGEVVTGERVLVFNKEGCDERVCLIDSFLGDIIVELLVGVRITEVIEEDMFNVFLVLYDTRAEVFIRREDNKVLFLSKGS